jgi:restriction endonuclease S subunit
VKKEKIAESGDYNLSGDRYKETIVYNGKWDFVELGEVCEIYQPKTIAQKEMKEDGEYLVFGANGIIGRFNKYNHEKAEVLITCRGATCGTVNMSEPKSWITGNAMVVKPKDNNLNKKYLFYLLKHSILTSTISGSAQPQITRQGLSPFKIPLPPLEIQEQIIAELDNYQKIIDGAKQVVENYKPTFKIDPEWEIVEIENICKNIKNITNPKGLTGQINYIGLENIAKNNGELFGNIKSEISEIKSMKLKFQEKNVLYAKLRPNLNKVYYAEINGICSTDIMVLKFEEDKAIPKLYSSIIREQWFNKKVLNGIKGAQLPRIGWDYFKKIKVPLPPIKIQQQIVTQIEREQKIINANKELITIFESKIKDKIADVWGEKK